MQTRTYFSVHIRKDLMSPSSVQDVEDDIVLFNRVRHAATADPEIRRASSRKGSGGSVPDMRKKENRAFLVNAAPSPHLRLKARFHTDDHFTNSAVNTAKAAIQSAKELNALNIEETQARLSDLRSARAGRRRNLTRLRNIKQMLIRASRAVKEGKAPSYSLAGIFERYDAGTGEFLILRGGKIKQSYSDPYLFEIRYVDPEIRRLEHTIRLLDEKEERLRIKAARMKETPPGICYGTKNFFRRQYDHDRYPDHDIWKQSFRKRRCRALMVSGRKDAVQGNFLFRYDPENRTLTYTSQQGRHKVIFPGVVFPYGQEKVEAAVLAPKADRHATAWRIIDTGGSFLIQCIVSEDEAPRLNDFFLDGCVCMDTNYDNLSIAQLDGCGNPLWHKVIPFDLEGCSSERAGHILSNVLEKVFGACRLANMPLAMEDLKLKHTADHYGSKKRNRVTSRFAFSKITDLVDSKSFKYGISVTKVDPAYTSQMGKVLYVKKYGLSVHEGAAVVIGRRAMGLCDRLPEPFRMGLSAAQASDKRLRQWKAAYREIKQLLPKDMYAFDFRAHTDTG